MPEIFKNLCRGLSAKISRRRSGLANAFLVLFLMTAIGGLAWLFYEARDEEPSKASDGNGKTAEQAEDVVALPGQDVFLPLPPIFPDNAPDDVGPTIPEDDAGAAAEDDADFDDTFLEDDDEAGFDDEDFINNTGTPLTLPGDEPPAEDEPEEPSPAGPAPSVQPPPLFSSSIDIFDPQHPNAAAEFSRLLNQAVSSGNYAEYSAFLLSRIKEALPRFIRSDGTLDYTAYSQNRNLVTAVEFCRLVKMVGAAEILRITHDNGGARKNGGEFLLWFVSSSKTPMSVFLRQVTLLDISEKNLPRALRLLYVLWKDTGQEDRDKYVNLALACALIHPNVAGKPGRARLFGKGDVPIRKVYRYFLNRDKKNLLRSDLTKMRIEELFFVVDVRLPVSEFKWVEKNMRYGRNTWCETAYRTVRFRQDVALGKTIHSAHTFEEYQKLGGTCDHQSYLAATTAKCAGIPAVTIRGDGLRRPVHWAAFFGRNGKWQAVYPSLTDKVRLFEHPCTMKMTHESVLLKAHEDRRERQIPQATDAIVLSAVLQQLKHSREALSVAWHAVETHPLKSCVWNNLIALRSLPENKTTQEEWENLYARLRIEIRENKDLLPLLLAIQSKIVGAAGTDSEKRLLLKKGLRYAKLQVEGDRLDLLLESIRIQGHAWTKAGGIKEVMRFYENELDEYAKVRTDLFSLILKVYVQELAGLKVPRSTWTDAAKNVERIFSFRIRTQSTGYFRVAMETSLEIQIAALYRRAGDLKKAERIVEKASRRRDRARKRSGLP